MVGCKALGVGLRRASNRTKETTPVSFLLNERGPADWELWQRCVENQDGWEPRSQAVIVTAKSATDALSAAPPLPSGFEWRAVSVIRPPADRYL
jgi:hypothetical protein